jgi:archaellum component FlaC
MDIVTKLEDAYAFLGDPLHREAANEIERLRGQVEELEEEVYLLSSDLAHIYVKIGDKPDENS